MIVVPLGASGSDGAGLRRPEGMFVQRIQSTPAMRARGRGKALPHREEPEEEP